MRSALVNDSTYIVDNIIVSSPVDPSPFQGTIMVGLQDPVYETQTIRHTANHPAGTTVTTNDDGSVTLTYPDGTSENFPAGTTVIVQADGTVTTTYVTTEEVLVSPGTPCDIGWIYDPATGTFSAP
jgi:hypothetical protein